MAEPSSQGPVWVAVITFAASLVIYGVKRLFSSSSVNRAVQAEKDRLLEAIRSHRQEWCGWVDKGQTSHHPLIPFAHLVYDKQIGHVGEIHRWQVKEIVRFFGYVDFINRFQALQPIYIESGHEDEFNCMYLKILANLLDRHSQKQ